MRLRRAAAAMALAGAAAVAGCGLGPGEETGRATLTVTRDYGAKRVLHLERPVRESETVLRLLDRGADLRTRYGGRFVQAINGVDGGQRGGRRSDWFFYVNGIWSDTGAAETRARGGDQIWWDFRDWGLAMRVPAVVGSWPEPFVHGSDGKRFPVRIDCFGDRHPCDAVADRLDQEGVPASFGAEGAKVGGSLLRMVVGPWAAVRDDRAAALLESSPSTSGVFAEFQSQALFLRDPRGESVTAIGPGAGLVAAVRLEGQQPTWIITGTNARGVTAAVTLLDRADLRDHYAVAVASNGETVPVPTPALPRPRPPK